ncbi:MAG: hypothetical protein D6800_00880 [Candidatus Zixiibacteriota bacterium]|nr:MAG: hypothetical protein D6800_00880 [candidate division Zixibacteria bacterium]
MLRNLGFLFLAVSLTLFFSFGCGDDNSPVGGNTPDSATVAARLDASLHGSTNGMAWWYSSSNGGFEKFTNLSYDDLACRDCHVTGADCRTCHPDDGNGGFGKPVADSCYKCHGRQKAEAAVHPDVHMTQYGLTCADCHSSEDIHPATAAPNSVYNGAVKTNCQQSGCHTDPATIHGTNAIYNQHKDDFYCAACHTNNTISCINCHFENEVLNGKKIANNQAHGWKLLIKYQKAGDPAPKVYPGTIMTMTYHDSAFYAIGPYYGHAITIPTSCSDCHNSPANQMYNDSGYIRLLTWNKNTRKLEPIDGVVPIPDDWQTALKIDFATMDSNGVWIYQQDSCSQNGTEMHFAQPVGRIPKF